MTNTGKSESMVDRVARAMCEAADDDWNWSVFYIVDVNDTVETGREVYRDMARAAINTMRDIDLVYAVLEPRTEEDIAYGRRDFAGDSGNWLWLWNKAIDAALKE